MANTTLFDYRHDTGQEFLSYIAALIRRLLQYPPRTSKVLSFVKVRQLLHIDDMKMSRTNKASISIYSPSSLPIKVFVAIKNHHNSE